MLYFNFQLFQNLSSIFGMTQKAFSIKVYGTEHKYKRRLAFPDRLLVVDVVNLCNILKMSISHFFSITPEVDNAPNMGYYVIEERNFKEINFNYGAFGLLHGKNGILGKVTIDEIASKMKMSYATFASWEDTPNNIKMDAFLKLCNTFNLPLSTFIDDPNGTLVTVPKEDKDYQTKEILHNMRTLTEAVSRSEAEIKRLREHINAQKGPAVEYVPQEETRGKIGEGDGTFAILKEDNRLLRIENEKLTREIDQLQAEAAKAEETIRELRDENTRLQQMVTDISKQLSGLNQLIQGVEG